jgi:RNA polymerase sigma-70 factor (ECF subfamily)
MARHEAIASPKAAASAAWVAEHDLVDRIRAGEEAAFRQLMQRYNQRLYRVARAIVSDDSEAEDVLQESYTRAFAAIDGFRGESGLQTWLTRIVINESRGRLRRRRPRVALDQVERIQESGALVLGFPGGQVVESPDSQAARAEVRLLLEQAVDRLPDIFRLVFILREIQECSVEETAELMGVRPETVKTRLHRARRLLREALDASLAEALHGSFPFLGKRCARLTEAVMQRIAAART